MVHFIEALDSVIEDYNSVDIRTVAFYSENIWKSLVTIVRFRIETMNEVKKQHEKYKKYNLIWNDKFHVGLYVYPIHEWKKIHNDWEKNRIELQPNFVINIPKEDLNRHVNDSPEYASFDEVNKEWRVFAYDPRGSNETYSQTILLDQNKFARDNNFGSIYDYLHAILEVKESYIIWQNSCNMIVAPVFFMIDKAKFVDHTLTVEGRWHPNATIKLVIQIYNKEHDGTKGTLRENIPLVLKTDDGSKPIQNFTFIKKIEEGIDGEQFDIVVINKGMLLQRYGGRIESTQPKKINGQNSVFRVFDEIVTFDNLKNMLIDFEPKNRKDMALVFERGVSWMLSLLGFNTILLGKGHERFKKDPKIVLDILAFYKEQILLVNVTTGALDAPDITRLKHIKKKLGKTFEDLDINPILFSSLSAHELRSTIGEDEVRLVGIEDLERIFSLLENGEIDRARSLLLTRSPKFRGGITGY